MTALPDNDRADGADALNESLSAVADGSATPADWARVNAAWAHDPELRDRWALWHAAGDGLRAADLQPLRRDPRALLDAIHAQIPAPIPASETARPRRRDWFAPFAVAAGFIAVAVGVTSVRPPSPSDDLVAGGPAVTRGQPPVGTSFAQTAVGRAAPESVGAGMREAGLVLEATPPEIAGWSQGLASAEPPASRPGP